MAHVIENRGPELFAIDVTFMVAAIIASSLRCYVRVFMVKAFGRDDWLMLFATVSTRFYKRPFPSLLTVLQCTFISYCSSSIIGVHYGTGRHHRDLPVPDMQKAIRVSEENHAFQFRLLQRTYSLEFVRSGHMLTN